MLEWVSGRRSAAAGFYCRAAVSAVILMLLMTDFASSSSGRWCRRSTLHARSSAASQTPQLKDLMLLSHWNNFPALFRAFRVDSPSSSLAASFKSTRG
ncbi:hypothetical protein INR49_012009 [Caranx melampygus]|nr:hypothetical protein INR49_012009 [Caranx melampygus]